MITNKEAYLTVLKILTSTQYDSEEYRSLLKLSGYILSKCDIDELELLDAVRKDYFAEEK